MANCPKCGVKLKITDWRPNCPKCNVNLVYYGMEERLLADADKAESEHAVFQKKLDRVKASFSGSKLTITRIVLSVLPILALFLPLAKVSLQGPFIAGKDAVTVNAIKLYEVISGLDFGGMFELIGSKIMGQPILMYVIAVLCVAVAVVLILVNLIVLMLSCSPHGKGRNITINSIQLVASVAATLLFAQSSKGLASLFPGTYSGGISFGAYIFIVCILALLAINVIIAKVGVPIKYKETFVNGIPSEEYFKAVEKGEDITALRAKYAPPEEEEGEEAKAKEEAQEAEPVAAQ